MNFSVFIESWKRQTIKQLPDGWSADDYQALLGLLDVDDVPTAEAKDYVLMALSELDKSEAATIILTFLLGNTLTKGQIQNAAHELEEEKLWEEYPDIAVQRGFFQAVGLLYEAFNGGFPSPKAQQLNFIIKPHSLSSAVDMKKLTPRDLLRLISVGFDEHSLMRRLFKEQLEGASFPEADGIVWHKSINMLTPDTVELILISSEYWLEDFDASESFKSSLVKIQTGVEE